MQEDAIAHEEKNYQRMDALARRQFLAGHVHARYTDLSGRFVMSVLRWESDATCRWFLIKAVGLMKMVDGIPILLQICQQPEVDFKHTSLHAICAWSLGQIGDSAKNEVLMLLSHPNSETRRCAADTLGELRAAAAIPALVSALKNDEQSVQLWAGLALAKIGIQSIPFLEQTVIESAGPARLIAFDALEKIASASLGAGSKDID
jgi:HEAT repeat protein